MAHLLNVLIVEDSATDADLLVRELRRAGFDPQWTRVETEATFLAALHSAPELILSDYSMPQFDGLHAFKLLCETGRDIPFILVSGTVGEELAVEAMRTGVTDYLLKDRLGRLGSAVLRALDETKLRQKRRLMERQLEASEKRYRRLFESAKDGILILNAETGMVDDLNPFLIDLLGFTKKDFVSKKVWELRGFRDLIANEEKFLDLQRSEYVRYDGLPLQANDGRRIDVEFESNVYDVDGTKVIQCNIRDITARKQTEALLRIQNWAIQSATEGIVIADALQPELPIIFVNRGFESITGYSAAEARGRNCRFLQGKETDPAAIASIRAALNEVRPITIELMNYRKDGTPFWNKTSITPVGDEAGRLTHFVGIQVDVTETRNTREQLHQSQKMDAIGRLASGLAHDFNNLLAVIDSFADMLLEDLVDSEPARSFVQQIQSTSVLGANLTQQLLAFGRRQTRSPEALDFNALVRETIQMLQRLLGDEIDLELSLAPDLKWVFADRSQMSQLLINLAINARDAMSGRGQLSVRTESVILTTAHLVYGYRLEPGEYAYLEVTDTGCGMTADILDQIFEPLFTTKPIGQGTGLGLSTVYGIVTQSGGGIEVDSVVGTGTNFGIYLPIA